MSLSELVSTNPCTSETVWSGPVASAADVDAATRRARRAFTRWSLTPVHERIACAERYRDTVKDQGEALAALISRETGKPLWEARTEVASVAGKVDISVRAYHARTGHSETPMGDARAVLRHRPHGVLAVLGPYNFPAHLPNGHIVPALIAGNCVLFKPSELTPAVALMMAQLWAEAGLPEDVLIVLPGDGATGKALAGHDAIDGLLFTGSAHTGAALHRQFSGSPQRILALEMGGNNPLIAWDVDDMEAAAALIVQSAYLSAGQRCTCARRLIVESGSKGDELVEAVIALADRLVIGAPFDEPQPFMGPVVSNAAAERLMAGFDLLAGQGGRVLRPLGRRDPALPFLTPALVDVTGLASLDDEHFGPLLQLIRAADFDAALKSANATRFGLAAGLIGGDEALYLRFWQQSRAGIVNWNRPLTGASSAAPFGGIGASGNHRPSAYYAADYCAYPVAGLEQQTLAGVIEIGLRA